jgi:hypothetical protein
MKLRDELRVLQEIEKSEKLKIKEVDLGHTVLTTFDELEEYVLTNGLEGKELDNLISDATGAFIDSSIGTKEVLKKVREFMEQWSVMYGLEIPFFIA